MKKKVIIVLIVSFISSILGAVSAVFFHKELIIKPYDKDVKVEVFKEYSDKKLDICYGSLIKCKNINYETNGEVDINTVGDYKLEYSFNVDKKVKKLIRTVHVYDDTLPEIINEEVITVCKNGNMVDTKYSAHDNYDGDLTDKVELINENDKYYLSVNDSSNNNYKLEVKTKEYDGEPSLSLKGNNPLYLVKGSKYNEPGYTATDKCDGDLTSNVKVTNNINSSKTGSYTVTYTLTNNNKTVTKKRTVKVITNTSYNVPATGSKIIYLTFDDGPGAYTTKLLNILDKYNVKATFFVTNQFSNSNYLKLISREASSGHTVCIHSYTHNYNIYKSVDAYFNDLNKMNNVIEQKTGKKSNCVRFPGGSSNTVSRKYAKGIMKTLTNELGNRGYRYYDWNLSSGDAGGTTSSKGVYNNVVRNLKGGTYNILMHDIKSYTVNAVEDIIKYGLANGYKFLPITSSSPTFRQRVNN